MEKCSNDYRRFLDSLRLRHDKINTNLGDDGLLGAMSNYTGQSHLKDAITNNLLSDSVSGAGIGALSGAFLLPMLGYQMPDKFLRHGAVAGVGAGLGLSALSSLAKYYAGKTFANQGE